MQRLKAFAASYKDDDVLDAKKQTLNLITNYNSKKFDKFLNYIKKKNFAAWHVVELLKLQNKEGWTLLMKTAHNGNVNDWEQFLNFLSKVAEQPNQADFICNQLKLKNKDGNTFLILVGDQSIDKIKKTFAFLLDLVIKGANVDNVTSLFSIANTSTSKFGDKVYNKEKEEEYISTLIRLLHAGANPIKIYELLSLGQTYVCFTSRVDSLKNLFLVLLIDLVNKQIKPEEIHKKVYLVNWAKDSFPGHLVSLNDPNLIYKIINSNLFPEYHYCFQKNAKALYAYIQNLPLGEKLQILQDANDISHPLGKFFKKYAPNIHLANETLLTELETTKVINDHLLIIEDPTTGEKWTIKKSALQTILQTQAKCISGNENNKNESPSKNVNKVSKPSTFFPNSRDNNTIYCELPSRSIYDKMQDLKKDENVYEEGRNKNFGC